MSVKVTWYGHSTTGIETSVVKLLIDPFFSGNSLAPVKHEEVEADVIVVTHGHDDHVGDTVEIARRTGALVISMGPDDAVRAVDLLDPTMVIPMHYDTFDVIQQDPVEWSTRVERKTSAKVSLLKPGESVTLEYK